MYLHTVHLNLLMSKMFFICSAFNLICLKSKHVWIKKLYIYACCVQIIGPTLQYCTSEQMCTFRHVSTYKQGGWEVNGEFCFNISYFQIHLCVLCETLEWYWMDQIKRFLLKSKQTNVICTYKFTFHTIEPENGNCGGGRKSSRVWKPRGLANVTKTMQICKTRPFTDLVY
jgi:hypothetical protein